MNMPKKYYFVVLPILALLSSCASTPASLQGAAVFAACPAFTATEQQASPPALPAAACAEQASIYSNAIWLPFFGPLYEAAINQSPDSEPGLTVLSTLLPGIGPALQSGLGAKRCLAQCLPPAAVALAQADATQIKAYFDQALDVSDGNCEHFLQQWRSGETESAATVGGLGQGRLEAVLTDTLRENRRQARQVLQRLKPTAAEVQSRIAAYDGLCSVDHALATMEDATRNQLAGSFTSDMAEQKAWLAKSGISAANDDGKPKDNIRHINNILRPTLPGLAKPAADKKKPKKR